MTVSSCSFFVLFGGEQVGYPNWFDELLQQAGYVMTIAFGIFMPAYGALFYRESTHPSTASMPLSLRPR